MVDKDGRNFRAFYYDTLGLRNVEQRKALEILLKDDPIGWWIMAAMVFPFMTFHV